MSPVALPFSPVPGADKPNTLNEAAQANFDALAMAIVVPAPVARGTGTLTYSANNDASFTVAHGLPATPQYVVATPRSAGTASLAAPACTARDATNITISARTYNGANQSMSVLVDWQASL